MRLSNYFAPTVKEEPKDAEIASHKLMIRAGLMRKLSSGVFSLLPMGFKVYKKIENIVREELNKKGALELSLPILQSKEIWDETGRWEVYGDLMMKVKDRHGRLFGIAPTAEEVICNTVRNEIKSYKNLPLNLYQIGTKFRDEIRPRFGVMRGREFVMKDGYSFHADDECLNKTYKDMFEAYSSIFDRCGLNFKAVRAHSGDIGGSESHEFMVLASSGEDSIINCPSCGYAANIELAQSRICYKEEEIKEELKKVTTPSKKTVEDVCAFLNKKPENLIKTILYLIDGKPSAVLIRGDREVNEVKLKEIKKAEEVILADEEWVKKITLCEPGFAGPLNLKDAEILADESARGINNAVCGANEKDFHYTGLSEQRDLALEKFYNLSNAKEGDKCVSCGGRLEEIRGIEVGHIFKLGTKYSEKMNASFQDSGGKNKFFIMGCYGIGVTRLIAAAIEQNSDGNGIIWPSSISPFQVYLMFISKKEEEQVKAAEKIYKELTAFGIEVIYDDRDERPGIKFKDADLYGMPVKVIAGKNIKENKVEIKLRKIKESFEIETEELKEKLVELLK